MRFIHAMLAALIFGGCASTVQQVKVTNSDRPGCFAEPSETPEGVELIYYQHVWQKDRFPGIEVQLSECSTNESGK